FVLVTLDAGQQPLMLFSTLLVGICIGLYFFNAPPARLFLGDGGAQTLGFILAAIAIAYLPRNAYQSSSWFVPILLLGVPIFDMFLVVTSRLRRRKPVYRSARDHTYHQLRARGMSPERAVLIMHLAGILLGCLAAASLQQAPLVANAIFLAIILLGVGLIIVLDRNHQ
ncbi:MAG: undecaprenyl/decaprenyl-phosphate alpha-N-acetylglucosaminyl 1-phosphate transferase, partial [Anaerolineales bacterium]|nr:undecaprenyl/decaprenyl-phosphate alpha-N-acetylglucosaminyl 1-phosphate transferase [Anaerolineales bacterium]